MSPKIIFLVFLVAAVLVSIIAGLLMAMLESDGAVVVGAVAGTFTATLTLSMTAYYFLRQPS